MAQIFGNSYKRHFKVKIRTQDIDRILTVSRTLLGIEKLEGFDRHIKEYSKGSFEDHRFTARTAFWLVDQGFEVEMEPVVPDSGKGRPDLRCIKSEEEQVFIECKRIRKGKFYGFDEKERIADIVYEKVMTCDQLTIYLHSISGVKTLEAELESQTLVKKIHCAGLSSKDTTIVVDNSLSINVIRKPAIIGAEDDFLQAVLEVFLEDVNDGERLPGFVFMKGGRSIAVVGPPPDYSPIWNRKRSKSKKQSVQGFPLIVMICGEDVLGKPADHEHYFKRCWLTGNNNVCSGIAILSMTTTDGKPRIQLFENHDALHPLPEGFFNQTPV